MKVLLCLSDAFLLPFSSWFSLQPRHAFPNPSCNKQTQLTSSFHVLVCVYLCLNVGPLSHIGHLGLAIQPNRILLLCENATVGLRYSANSMSSSHWRTYKNNHLHFPELSVFGWISLAFHLFFSLVVSFPETSKIDCEISKFALYKKYIHKPKSLDQTHYSRTIIMF